MSFPQELTAIDAELSLLGMNGPTAARRSSRVSKGRSASGKGSRSRPKNKLTLPDAIAAAMDMGAVVSPAEAAKLVKANGYKTTSKTFSVNVSQALTKDERFKRVGRGQYERVA
jgi:hypothetical protein